MLVQYLNTVAAKKAVLLHKDNKNSNNNNELFSLNW